MVRSVISWNETEAMPQRLDAFVQWCKLRQHVFPIYQSINQSIKAHL